MSAADIKQYLLPLEISPDDKRYTLNFCKKRDYLESVNKKVADATGMDVSAGYGDLNSNICFIFNNHKILDAAKKIIQEKMDMFGLNFWQVYVTFLNKVQCDYPYKYEVIVSELSAIKPQLLYVFDTEEIVYDKIKETAARLNVQMPERSFFVDIVEMGTDDEEIKKRLWHTLRYLINYQTVDNRN